MSNQQTTQAMTTRPEPTRVQYLTRLFERSSAKLAQVAPKHVTPERMVRLLAGSLSRIPDLLECTEGSLLVALMTATQLGLEPNTPLGHGYIIPVWNGKIGKKEAQFWPGWRGLVHLAEQTGVIKGMRSRIVRARDVWDYEDTHEGERWRFVPADGDRGDFRKVFAVAERGKDIRPQIEVMSIAEVWKIRDASPSARSKYGLSGPWVTHPEEMIRKTAIKRLSKQIPLSTEEDTTDPERPLNAPGDRFTRALVVDRESGDETIDTMIAEASRVPELSTTSEPSSSSEGAPPPPPPAEASPPPPPAPAAEPPKKSRAEAAKEKVKAAAKGNAPPPPEPVAPSAPAAGEPEPPPPVEATADAPPEDDEPPPAPPAETPPPPAPAPVAAPPSELLAGELAKLEAAKTTAEIRAWYDALIARWDSIPTADRKELGAAYKLKLSTIAK